MHDEYIDDSWVVCMGVCMMFLDACVSVCDWAYVLLMSTGVCSEAYVREVFVDE